MSMRGKGRWSLYCAATTVLLSSMCVTNTVLAQSTLTPTEALAQTGKTKRIVTGKQFFGDGKYAGSESCKSCHAPHYNDWSKTWHAKMERWPSPDIIVGDFDNRTIQLKNIRARNKEGKEEVINPTAFTFRKGDKFFFTLIDKDDDANSQTWEVAKVIGGNWDQGYEVKLGEDNFLPSPLRWSVGQKDWLVGGFNPQDWYLADGTPDGRPLRPEELPMNRVAESKCNGCHTTGFKFAKNDKGVWKGHEHGKGEIGIGCESCHGPGARHVEEAQTAKTAGKTLRAGETAIVNPLTDLTAEQATQVCAQCHGRGTHKEQTDLAFPTGFLPGDTDLTSRYRFWSHSGTNVKRESDYFWRNDWASRNRQQWQDFTKSAHYYKAGMSCITCHTFHGKAEYAQLREKPQAMCENCHKADGVAKRPNAEMFASSPMQKAGVQCIDCHMARIGSRSRATSKSGHQWDTSSHTFLVPTPALEKTLGVRSACKECHDGNGKTMPTGAAAPAMDSDVLQAVVAQRRQETREGIDAVQKILAGIRSSKPEARALADQANAKIRFVLLDGSLGMHNQERAADLIAEARKLAERAARIK